MGKAQCEVCRRVQNGEPLLTEDQLRDYTLAHGAKEDVSMVLLREEHKQASPKFTLRSLGGDMMEALFGGVINIRNTKAGKIDEQSTIVAKSKRRGSLLEGVDLSPGSKTELGMGMTEVDQALQRGKE